MANDLFARGSVMSADVRNLAAAQRELQQLQQAVSTQPGGGLRSRLMLGLLQLHRYASAIVPVRTGRLKNSLFTEIEGQGNDLVGHLATNVEYAPPVEQRRRFFARTVREEGPNVANDIISIAEVRP